MAQKINPTSLRLGILQLWTSNIQFYGNSFRVYFLLFHNYLKLYWFLKKLSNLEGYGIIYQKWKITKFGIKLNIYYTKLFFLSDQNFIKFYKNIYKILNKIFLNQAGLIFFLVPALFLSNNLLYFYGQYLINQKISINKVLWNFSKILEREIGSKKLIYTKFGIKILELQGFKISISGRIDDSKTQMAKKLNFGVGNLCLTTLHSYIAYSQSTFYTKSGTYGIKTWLFYKSKL
nr:ribosomal protein S3 [Calliblepharis sp.]